MINLDQIQILENKVNHAVEIINRLTKENKALKRTIENSQSRMQELESLLDQFKNEQDQIEKGILNALHQLDHLEDSLDSEVSTEAVSQSKMKIQDTQAVEQGASIQEDFFAAHDVSKEGSEDSFTGDGEFTEASETQAKHRAVNSNKESSENLLFGDDEEEIDSLDSKSSSTDVSLEKAEDPDEEEEETELDIF
ncbi:MAG: cell division protein ZapB [Spirochaetales bacterium]|nr:cell division protein ZapB [Spirochaetales bacterium]